MQHSALAKIGLPLLAALVYSGIAITFKRLANRGIGPCRLTFATNIGQAVAVLPLWFLGDASPSTNLLWQPAATALAFLIGQIALFLAMDRGDVSVVTPLLGSKVIMVAALATALFHKPVPKSLWLAATLATAATALLSIGKPIDKHRLRSSLAWGTVAALAFSLTDILYEQWSGNLDVWRFSVLVFSMMAALSLPLIRHLEPLPASAQPSFLPTIATLSLVLGAQIVLVAYSIVEVCGATLTNILYSSRGLFSVVLVWMLGTRLGMTEADSSRELLPIRMLASAIMLIAIALGTLA
jgi:drug/metabolite transporter (DMT)-like permease